jgi:plasmid stabilization system protein ParE
MHRFESAGRPSRWIAVVHLGLAAQRPAAASHILFYEQRRTAEGAFVVILRVLHDRMDLERHIDTAIG